MSHATDPLSLTPMQRAAVVTSYRALFTKARTANKPRSVSFKEAMRLRARWICGEPLRELARRYLEGRDDHASLVLSGRSYLTPSPSEEGDFTSVVDSFYAALAACDLGPADALPGTARTLPLEQFIRGEFVAPVKEAKDEDERRPLAAPATKAPAVRAPFVSVPWPREKGHCTCPTRGSLVTQPRSVLGDTLKCVDCGETWSEKDAQFVQFRMAEQDKASMVRPVVADPFA